MTESTTMATPAPDDRAFTESVQILQQHIDHKAYPQAIVKYNELQQKYGADGNPAHHDALAHLAPLLDQLKYLHKEEALKVALDKCYHFITKRWADLAQGQLTQAKDHLTQVQEGENTPQIAKYQKRIGKYERYIHVLNKVIREPAISPSTLNPPVPIEDQTKGSVHTDLIAHQYHILSFKCTDSPYLQVILPIVGGIYYQFLPSPHPECNQGVISLIILSKKTPLNVPDRETFMTVRHQILATEAITALFTAGFPNIALLPNLRARIGHTVFEVDLTFVHLQEEYPDLIYNDDIWECPLSEFSHFLQYLGARYEAYHRVKFEYYQHHHYFLLRARTLSRMAYTTIGLSAALVGFAILEGLAIPFSPFWYGVSLLPLGVMVGTGVGYRRKNRQLDQVLRLLHPMTLPMQIKKDVIHLVSDEYREFLEVEFKELSHLPPLPKETQPLTDATLPPSEISPSQKKGRFILHSLVIPRPNFQHVKQILQKVNQWVHNVWSKIQIKKHLGKFSHAIRTVFGKIHVKKGIQAILQGIRGLSHKIRSLFTQVQQRLSQRKPKSTTRIKRTPKHHQPPKSAIKQEITDYFSS